MKWKPCPWRPGDDWKRAGDLARVRYGPGAPPETQEQAFGEIKVGRMREWDVTHLFESPDLPVRWSFYTYLGRVGVMVQRTEDEAFYPVPLLCGDHVRQAGVILWFSMPATEDKSFLRPSPMGWTHAHMVGNWPPVAYHGGLAYAAPYHRLQSWDRFVEIHEGARRDTELRDLKRDGYHERGCSQ